MKILFIDHVCHKKTHSADFFLDILRQDNEIRTFYYDKAYDCHVPEKVKNWADVVIIWEFLVSRKNLGIPGKPCIFVPMYDNEWGSYWQWRRIAMSGMAVISFCNQIAEHARRCGVKEILDIRYFPNPSTLLQDQGDSRLVFLWERGEMTKGGIKVMFPPEDGWRFDFKRADDFQPRDDYLKRLTKCGVVVAPRRKEGIGMAFLEAMSMGKCVVAHNDATMNEYIINGTNGILINFTRPRRIMPCEVENVRMNMLPSLKQLNARWMLDSVKLAPFVSKIAQGAPMKARCKMFDTFMYLAFLMEGVIMKLKG